VSKVSIIKPVVFQDPVSTLPPDLRARAEALFSILMDYILQLLTWEIDESNDCRNTLPSGLQPDEPDNTFVTMLFNDEVHTYEQVSDSFSLLSLMLAPLLQFFL
jgi:E3 ubiquitin-protein ligase UBR2